MWKWLLILSVSGTLTIGCKSPDQAKVLSNEGFMKQFSASVAADTTITNAPAGPKLIAPGMVLTISVVEDASLNRQYPVPPSGVIDVPAAGRMKVIGLTVEELAEKIKQPLERDFFQKATVTVSLDAVPIAPTGSASDAGVSGGVVYLLGNIGRPGPLLLPGNEVFTLTKAIVAAGGLTTFGNGGKVRIVRYDSNGKKYETRVNVDNIMKQGLFEKDVPLQNGDWIIVPEKWINF
jgi:polysaccharide export outer membrane protein